MQKIALYPIQMKKIESSQNAYFKVLLKLLKTSGQKKEKLFLVMGSKTVQEIWQEHEPQVECVVIFDEDQGRNFDNSKKLLLVTKEMFKELDVFETKSPMLVMDLPEVMDWKPTQPKGLELFLPVQDPSNLGAIVRSAAAFGVSKIVLLKECASPFHPKAVRASSGMVLKMNFEHGPSVRDLHAQLSKASSDFYALHVNGQSLASFKWPKNVSLILGEEGQGLPPEFITDEKNILSIPIEENCESLNVMAATSIALYEYHKKK